MNNSDKNKSAKPSTKPNMKKRISPPNTSPKQNSIKKNENSLRQVKKTPKPTQKKFKRKPSPAKKQRITVVLTLFLTLYLVISLFIASYIYFSFDKESKNADIYSLQLKHDEKRIHTFDSKEVNNSYGLYVPYQKLSDVCNLSIVGDSDTVIIMISPDCGTIKCTKDSSLIYINNNPVRVSAPVLFGKNDYLIPIELIDLYFIGVDVAYNNDKMLCIISTATKSPITLKMQLPTELEKTYFDDNYKKITSSDSSDVNDDNSNN